MKILILMTSLLLTSATSKYQYSGLKLPNLVLEGEDGGHLDDKKWSLYEMVGKKVLVIFYVDPDEKDKNEDISERLNAKNYPDSKIQYIGIINYKASWAPDFAISLALKKKQKKYPQTLYLKDYGKLGVKRWNVADDENNVLVLDQKGHVVFHKFGQVNQEEGDKLLSLIEKLIK